MLLKIVYYLLLLSVGFTATASAQSPSRGSAEPRYVPRAGTTYSLEIRTLQFDNGTPTTDNTSLMVDFHVVGENGTTGTTSNLILDRLNNDPSKFNDIPSERRAEIARTMGEWRNSFHYFLVADSEQTIKRDGADRKFATTYACDWSQLASFFPVGRLPRLELTCMRSVRSGEEPARSENVHITLSYEGDSHVKVPAGEYDVKKVRVRYDVGQSHRDTLQYLSETLGLPVKSEGTFSFDASSPQHGISTQTQTQLMSEHSGVDSLPQDPQKSPRDLAFQRQWSDVAGWRVGIFATSTPDRSPVCYFQTNYVTANTTNYRVWGFYSTNGRLSLSVGAPNAWAFEQSDGMTLTIDGTDVGKFAYESPPKDVMFWQAISVMFSKERTRRTLDLLRAAKRLRVSTGSAFDTTVYEADMVPGALQHFTECIEHVKTIH